MSDNPVDILKRVMEINGKPLDSRKEEVIRKYLDEEVTAPTIKKVIKYVEWVEPYYYHKDEQYTSHVPITKRVTIKDAIVVQKATVELENKVKNRNFKYDSDELALEDFIVTCWGRVVEVEE